MSIHVTFCNSDVGLYKGHWDLGKDTKVWDYFYEAKSIVN